nr:DNA cytosine methyltransferase [Flavonifractor plautii]
MGSLFDGSGTCPLAASAVGIKPAWASEIEPFPMAVTQSRFPNMTHLGDITKMDGSKIEPVDVITFGSPCQNLSIAGNRKGLAGEQSSLFLEAVRVISEMRCATNGRYPQIAIWENVYGAFSSTQGKDFRTVLETLWQICEGSDSVPRFEEDRSGRQKWPKRGFIVGDHSSIAWRGLDAQFWGVAQRRKRVSLRSDNIVQTLAGRMGTGGGNVPLILVPCYGQTSYDEYQPSEQSTTLKASGGNYGGGY